MRLWYISQVLFCWCRPMFLCTQLWESGYLRLCLGNFPHLLLPLLLWLKLSLAYLTQAYVDFIPRHSEAVPSFEAGALCGFEASE